jgi:hypothetical protein
LQQLLSEIREQRSEISRANQGKRHAMSLAERSALTAARNKLISDL